MRSLRISGLPCVAALPLILVMLSCNARTLTVEIPHGFSGPVRISCVSNGNLHTTTVDYSGSGVVVCGKNVVDVRAVRDGKIIDVDSLKWQTAGDGVPVSVTFTVP